MIALKETDSGLKQWACLLSVWPLYAPDSIDGRFWRLKTVPALKGSKDIYFWRQEMKWNESGFRPLLCTYELNWVRRTSWGWWDEWDDTALQTQDSKFKPWRSEVECATSRSWRLPTILSFRSGWGRNSFVSFKPPRPGNEPRTRAWNTAVLITTLGPPPLTGSLHGRVRHLTPYLTQHSASK